MMYKLKYVDNLEEGDGCSSRKRMGDGKINGSVSGGCGGAEEKEEEGSRI
jgi:hypothetical protein